MGIEMLLWCLARAFSFSFIETMDVARALMNNLTSHIVIFTLWLVHIQAKARVASTLDQLTSSTTPSTLCSLTPPYFSPSDMPSLVFALAVSCV